MISLAMGSRGPEVVEVQQRLAALGLYRDGIDGIYGRKTTAAVAEFQRRYLVTGAVDLGTRGRLSEVYAFDKEVRGAMSEFKTPKGHRELVETFGEIEFEDAGGGYVSITNDWADHYVARAELPIIGRQSVHVRLVDAFVEVFEAIEVEGLADEIHQWGIWCPRHKMHDPKRSLSTHSWAIAIDLNWATNPVGRIGDMNRRVVAIFEGAGFEWGGRWKHRDDMHFQFAKEY